MINGTLIKCHPRFCVQAACERYAWIQAILSNGIIVHLREPEDALRIKRRAKYLEKLRSDQWKDEEWEKRGFDISKFKRFPYPLTREGRKEASKRLRKRFKRVSKQAKNQTRKENGQFTPSLLP
jgi:hypothetical protein